MTVIELTTTGERLGLTREALREWVFAEVEYARVEKEAERLADAAELQYAEEIHEIEKRLVPLRAKVAEAESLEAKAESLEAGSESLTAEGKKDDAQGFPGIGKPLVALKVKIVAPDVGEFAEMCKTSRARSGATRR